MSYFRSLPKLPKMLDLFSRGERWLILINADPDAMASAMALKRIMCRRVQDVIIAKVNAVTRPDNLAMIRYSHLRMEDFSPRMTPHFDRFALLDSQPDHHPAFRDIAFSIIIDHHPLPETPHTADYCEIKPEYGATSTLMSEYLYNLDIRPGKRLATALQFGIKTDTSTFTRHFSDVDLRAYQYLSRFANPPLLSRIIRSEYHLHWLELFARACTNLYAMGSSGQYVFIGAVENTDILVNIADFFMRVYEIRWAAVAGIYGRTMVVIFRGDGISRDMGNCAGQAFREFGSAGGHKSMARAEFPVDAANGEDPELFVWQRLTLALGIEKKQGKQRAAASPCAPPVKKM
ncbi:MAG: DHH family phosphoesterase [Desulfovibrio sp.]|jgi:nanoRNase/pAp phosphatase (c-di-AMP/oligoRNAs hydrolase)|nr:DHH family phosphoesterase [Desulfovibrio sp.]